MATSLVLSGSVSQGAFDAGVLEVLAERGIPIASVAASSSGALNGLMYAAGIRAGEERAAARRLAELWAREATFWNLLTSSLSLRGIAKRRGLFDQRLLLALMRRHVRPCTSSTRYPVTLRIVVTPLHGRAVRIDGARYRTFEEVFTFRDADFDRPEALARVFEVAAASAAFPGLFVPGELAGHSPAVDGGLVHDTPIRHAIDYHTSRVLLVDAHPADYAPAGEIGGIALVEHLANVLIQERLVRDLQRVDGRVRVVPIRPPVPLAGTAFSSMWSRRRRLEYIAIGRACAADALGR